MIETLDLLPNPVIVTNGDGIVQEVNAAMLTWVGGQAAHWRNQSMNALLPVASRVFLQTHVWPLLLREGHVNEIRLQIKNTDGKAVSAFTNCKKSPTAQGDLFYWVFFVAAERSRFEDALLQARRRAEDVLKDLTQQERFIRTVTDALPSLIGYWDRDLRCRFANKTYQDWFAKSQEQMQGIHIRDLLGDTIYTLNAPMIEAALNGEACEFEREIQRPDGTKANTLANYIPDTDAQGRVNGFFALVSNVTKIREGEQASRLIASVFNNINEGLMITDAQGAILMVNAAFTHITGIDMAEAVARSSSILKSGRHDDTFYEDMWRAARDAGKWQGEVWSQRQDGSVFLMALSISAMRDERGQISRYVSVFSDATARWNKDQVVERMALHDSLTQLPNRNLLMERLGQLTSIASRSPRNIALLFLDLDGFKAVNDTWGHDAGDRVLTTVAGRLLAKLRLTDTVARLGGDEFIVLLDEANLMENVALIGQQLIDSINQPIDIGGTVAHVGTSMGIALYPHNGLTPQELLKAADDAMYAAKAAGKNTLRFAIPTKA
ncbi:sensor domain-containing protein [Rhodoferax aquaticus]|uniref:Sensor domain-containing diguanylate cyclase n=1 Tax=Rhodoferax aquaticus TaxID=2527691 RepID=A0A515ELB7_9BURK|nr:diguanylate cyclase [Rhodoferax aquaticus]QDL53460.1 sensor domain-containing diguanylate cyclase [Rhodoferax aquaticus]